MKISRRLFCGGAISLIAVQTFIPSTVSSGNIPVIYGGGVKEDSYGFMALFKNEPVIFNREMIGIDKHEGIIFHKGRFVISNTIEVPLGSKIKLELKEYLHFYGEKLDLNSPFFKCYEDEFESSFTSRDVIFEVKQEHNTYLIHNLNNNFENNLKLEHLDTYDVNLVKQKMLERI